MSMFVVIFMTTTAPLSRQGSSTGHSRRAVSRINASIVGARRSWPPTSLTWLRAVFIQTLTDTTDKGKLDKHSYFIKVFKRVTNVIEVTLLPF